MQKFIVSRDDTIYEAWPDLAMGADGRLVCIFSECTAHTNRELARLTIRISDDRGPQLVGQDLPVRARQAQRLLQLRAYIQSRRWQIRGRLRLFSKTNRM